MAWSAKRPQVRSIAVGGVVVGMADGQGKTLGMVQVVIVMPAVIDQLVGKLDPRFPWFAALTAALFTVPICGIFDLKGDRFPVVGIKASVHWHCFAPWGWIETRSIQKDRSIATIWAALASASLRVPVKGTIAGSPIL